MTSFFNDCRNIEELKTKYRKLAFVHHPDKGGDPEVMKAVNAEFDSVFAYFKRNGAYSNYQQQQQSAWSEAQRETYRRQQQKAYDQRKQQNKADDDTPEAFREMISKIIHLKGLKIEVCGQWIWVTGDTKTNKDALKAAGFWFSSKKSAWYWHTGSYHKRGKRDISLDEIRSMYGAATVKDDAEAV